MDPYLTSGPRRLGYHAINLVFAFLPVVYALAASGAFASFQAGR